MRDRPGLLAVGLIDLVGGDRELSVDARAALVRLAGVALTLERAYTKG